MNLIPTCIALTHKHNQHVDNVNVSQYEQTEISVTLLLLIHCIKQSNVILSW